MFVIVGVTFYYVNYRLLILSIMKSKYVAWFHPLDMNFKHLKKKADQSSSFVSSVLEDVAFGLVQNHFPSDIIFKKIV